MDKKNESLNNDMVLVGAIVYSFLLGYDVSSEGGWVFLNPIITAIGYVLASAILTVALLRSKVVWAGYASGAVTLIWIVVLVLRATP